MGGRRRVYLRNVAFRDTTSLAVSTLDVLLSISRVLLMTTMSDFKGSARALEENNMDAGGCVKVLGRFLSSILDHG